MPRNDFSAATSVYQTDERTFELDQLLIYVIEVNNEIAKASGLDLTSLAASGLDSAEAVRVIKTIGLTGRGYLKKSNGKLYLILKGNPGARPVLTGTRYLAANPMVAKLVVSARTLGASAARATGVSVVAYAGLRVVEHLLAENDPSMIRLFGNIGSDVLKFAVAAGAGYLAGLAVGALTTVIAGPLIAALIVGVGVSILLDRADRKYSLTETMIRAIEDVVDRYENPIRILARWVNDWERHLIQQAINQTTGMR
jgi:hypothetical protein